MLIPFSGMTEAWQRFHHSSDFTEHVVCTLCRKE